MQDRELRESVVEALGHEPGIDAKSLTVSVRRATVLLEGEVKAWCEREAAERAAWAVPGVADVDDRLHLTS